MIGKIDSNESHISMSCASLMCSHHESKCIDCSLLHSSGMIFSEEFGETYHPYLVRWISNKFREPITKQYHINTIYILVISLEKLIDYEIKQLDEIDDDYPFFEAICKVFNSLITYSVDWLKISSVNHNVLKHVRMNPFGLNLPSGHLNNIPDLLNEQRYQDEQNTAILLFRSILGAIEKWITLPVLNDVFEEILFEEYLPKMLDCLDLLPFSYLRDYEGEHKSRIIGIMKHLWARRENQSAHLCNRRTFTICYREELTEKLTKCLDDKSRKTFLADGIRSVSLYVETNIKKQK